MLAWALVTPVSAAGILAAHAVAYALTGTEPGAIHGYLAHAPHAVAVLATIGLVGLALQERGVGRRSLPSLRCSPRSGSRARSTSSGSRTRASCRGS